MKILVTGGAGFLGSNISAKLIEKGYDVSIVDNLSRIGSEANLDWLRTLGDFEFILETISNYDAMKTIIKQNSYDTIYHLAGQVAMTTSIENPYLDFQTNAIGTFNILNIARKYLHQPSIIYSSTNKVYGDLEWVDYVEMETRYEAPEYPKGFDENTPLDFHSPYGCSKGSADQYILDFSRIYDQRNVVFRHSSMYGSRQYATVDQGWIGWFIKNAMDIYHNKLQSKLTISGNGKQVRDLLYVSDLVELYTQTLDNLDSMHGEVFNIGGGMENSLSLIELFAYLEKTLDISMAFDQLPPRESDQKIFVAYNTKVSNIIKWKPRTAKNEGLGKMLEWVKHMS